MPSALLRGLGKTLFPGALLALSTKNQPQTAPAEKPADLPKITAEMIDHAAIIAGIHIEDGQKAAMLESLNSQRDDVLEIRKLDLANAIAPGFCF